MCYKASWRSHLSWRVLNRSKRVIKGKIIIKKEYGIKNNFKPEPNISFNIYNQKEQLKDIIGNYKPITLEKSPMKDLENNKYKSFFSKRINISKLGTSFNKFMRSSVNSLYEETMREHSQVFETWLDTLYEVIVLNIGDMSPALKGFLETINQLTERKQQLENNCEILKEQTSLIIDLISWKEL